MLLVQKAACQNMGKLYDLLVILQGEDTGPKAMTGKNYLSVQLK